MSTTTDSLADLRPVQPGSGQTLQRQVEDQVRWLAGEARFRDGELLPDELTLASRLGVSRGTARAALGRLVQEGVLERRAGVGTRVSRPRAESGIGAWRSFSREMAAKGITVVNFSTALRRARPSAAAASALQLDGKADAVQRLDRVRGWDERPVLVSRSWFHPRARLPADANWNEPLYDLIERHARVVAEGAREEFSAVAASAWAARQLAVRPGTPLLLRRHIVTDSARRPIEYAEVLYVSSRFTLTLELKRAER